MFLKKGFKQGYETCKTALQKNKYRNPLKGLAKDRNPLAKPRKKDRDLLRRPQKRMEFPDKKPGQKRIGVPEQILRQG